MFGLWYEYTNICSIPVKSRSICNIEKDKGFIYWQSYIGYKKYLMEICEIISHQNPDFSGGLTQYVSNHRCLDYLLDRLFRRRSKKTSKLRTYCRLVLSHWHAKVTLQNLHDDNLLIWSAIWSNHMYIYKLFTRRWATTIEVGRLWIPHNYAHSFVCFGYDQDISAWRIWVAYLAITVRVSSLA